MTLAVSSWHKSSKHGLVTALFHMFPVETKGSLQRWMSALSAPHWILTVFLKAVGAPLSKPQARRKLGPICLVAAGHGYLSTQEYLLCRTSWMPAFGRSNLEHVSISLTADLYLPGIKLEDGVVGCYLSAKECPPPTLHEISLAGESVPGIRKELLSWKPV